MRPITQRAACVGDGGNFVTTSRVCVARYAEASWIGLKWLEMANSGSKWHHRRQQGTPGEHNQDQQGHVVLCFVTIRVSGAARLAAG